jgi:hypothetical protein
MSFDLYLLALTDKETDRFDRSVAERAFAPLVRDVTGWEWDIRMPDGELTLAWFTIDLTPTITGFSVNRPPFMPTFWDAVFEVLRQTRTIVAWPTAGRPQYCVANREFADDLPPGFIESPDEIAFVSCGAEIEDAINASF